jgi:hypothetical protein
VPFQILSFRFSGGTAPHFEITIPTQPGGTYVIQFADSSGTTFAWQPFLNTNQAVGTYVETNTVPSNFTFTDDFTPATSGGSPTSQARFYRVMAVEPGTAP